MESKIEINAIVWSTDIESARKYAQVLTGSTQNEAGFYTTSTPEYTFNTYVRCPSVPNTATPTSITDIVFIQIEDELELLDAKNYLDSRRGIPMKVCLTTKFGQFEELECKNVNPAELANEKNTILKEALSFEKTLVNVFKKFDLNGNGLISTDELMSCSKELGHELTHDDAKMITDTLDKDNKGNIDFNGFKKWWVTGKSDFTNFRRIVKAELAVNKLIKMTSTNFNDYLSNLNENSNNVASSEVQQSMNINFHAKDDFENGIGLFIDISSGPEAKEIIQSMPEKLRNSPAFFTISIEMENNEIAAQTAEIVNEMLMPMIETIPQLSVSTQMGMRLNLRSNQNKLVFDVSVESLLAEIITNSLNIYNTKDLKMGGEGTLHLFTNVDINDIFSSDLNAWKLIEKALNMKMHFTTKAYNLRGAIDSVCGMIDKEIQSGALPHSFRNATNITRIASIMRSMDLDFKFDPAPIIDLIILKSTKKHIGEEKYSLMSFSEFKAQLSEEMNNKISETVADMREKMSHYVETASQMKEMIPPEFMDIIKSLNMEKIESQFGVSNDNLTMSVKLTLAMPKLNMIKDKILN